MTTSRALKDGIKRAFFEVYELGTRFGIHILPVHYYSAEPNIVELRKTKDLWAKASSLPGIRVDLDAQLKVLERACASFASEVAGATTYRTAIARNFGPGFGYIEAQALHGVIRTYAPARIVEIGSGVSTYCSYIALRANEIDGKVWEMTCIDPDPSSALRDLVRAEPKIRLITQKVQAVSLQEFTRLSADDLLFVDSSHAVKAGSDVNHLILEVLPRLNAGVLVQFHDNYFPYD
jgi:predicted O-methyltransferase YrrM